VSSDLTDATERVPPFLKSPGAGEKSLRGGGRCVRTPFVRAVGTFSTSQLTDKI
jgi:hypothetical protein